MPKVENPDAPKSPSIPPLPPAAMEKLSSPHSTTYVQADATSFREVVQRLTSPMDETRRAPVPPKRRSGLQERRQAPPKTALEIPSPGILQSSRSSPTSSSSAGFWTSLTTPSGYMEKLSIEEEAEEKAIKAKRFYLHPSPRSSKQKSEPALLLLFPTS